MTNEEIKKVIEALLFASDRPVSIEDLKTVFEEVEADVLKMLVSELRAEYEAQGKSFGITELAGGYQLVADPYYAPWIKKLLGKEKGQRLSMPTMETLAIIAYKQPITRSEVEAIRGVNVDGIVENLVEKNLIKISGRREAPGRPFVYTTTDEFLVIFGLRSLEDLPALKEFTEKDIQIGENKVIIENKPQVQPAADTATAGPENAVENKGPSLSGEVTAARDPFNGEKFGKGATTDGAQDSEVAKTN